MHFVWEPTQSEWAAQDALAKEAGIGIDLSCRFRRDHDGDGYHQFVAFGYDLPGSGTGHSWECESEDSFMHALRLLQSELRLDNPIPELEEDDEE